jgi:tetratricopeptide (TPR) repeat protein
MVAWQAPGAAQQSRYARASSQSSPISPPVLQTLERLLQPATEVEFYYRWGNLLHGQEKLTDAIQVYQKALKLNPQHAATLINQGLTFIERGKYDSAIANFQSILSRPDVAINATSLHTIAYYNLAIIYNRRGNVKQALKSVQASLKITPSFAKAQLLLKQLEGKSPAQRRR